MASVTITGVSPVTIDFEGSAGAEAVARSQVTSTDATEPVSYQFTVERGRVWLKVGASAGEMDILNELPFEVGEHSITFTPDVSPYFMEWSYKDEAKAKLVDFQPVAAGDLVLATPYEDEDRLRDLRWDQDLNVVWYADGRDMPRVLERRGVTSWSLRELLPEKGPFAPLNVGDTTVTASARVGTVTLTSNRPLFATYDAKTLIKLIHPGQVALETLNAVEDTTDSIRVTGIENTRVFSIRLSGMASGDVVVLERSVGNELSWVSAGTYTANTTVSFNDEYDNQIIYYRLRKSAHVGPVTAELTYAAGLTEGIARIHSVTADNEVEVDVIEPFASTNATSLWAFGAWGGRFGFPRAVALSDGRLWFFRNNEYWFSASDDFENFEIGALADQAGGRTLGGRMNTTEWAAGADGKLLIGTKGGESNIGTNAIDEVITPQNVRAKNRTSRGSHNHQAPVIDDHVVFISRSRERLYRFGYNPERADYDAFHLTRLNRDLGRAKTGSPFVEASFQYEPEPRLHVVREDGQMVGLVYDLEERVVAPYRIKMDNAEILSVCVIPGQPEDQVWVMVRRELAGGPVTTIEKFAPEYWDDITKAVRLHSAIIYDGAETSVLTGAAHLEGVEVYVWGDGGQQGPFTVTGGQITLNSPVRYAAWGRMYIGRWKSSRLTVGTLAAWKQVKRLAMWLHETAGGALRFGESFDPEVMTPIPDAEEGQQLDGPVAVLNHDEEYSFFGSTDRDPRLYVEMHTAGPATVLALAPTETSNG